MTKPLLIGAALGVVALAAGSAGYMFGAQPVASPATVTAASGPFDDAIRDYLLRNPEVIIEAQTELANKQEKAAQVAARAAIESNRDAIFSDPLNPVVGNPDGDVTVVEFFDYNCSFCKRAHADQIALLKDDPGIRFVYKEFPILGPGSYEAHRVAIAVQKIMPDAYGAFHDAVLNGPTQADGPTAIAAATALGIDEGELKSVMDAPDTQQKIMTNYQLAEALGINGTPAYVIGNEVISGAQGVAVLREKVAAARAASTGG